VNDCGVGSIVYNFVLGYDGDKIKTRRRAGRISGTSRSTRQAGAAQGSEDQLEIALIADGVAPADVYKVLSTPAGVDRAFNKLSQLKPHLIWWEKGAQPPQMLASGEAAMVSAYNGRIAARTDRQEELQDGLERQPLHVDSW